MIAQQLLSRKSRSSLCKMTGMRALRNFYSKSLYMIIHPCERNTYINQVVKARKVSSSISNRWHAKKEHEKGNTSHCVRNKRKCGHNMAYQAAKHASAGFIAENVMPRITTHERSCFFLETLSSPLLQLRLQIPASWCSIGLTIGLSSHWGRCRFTQCTSLFAPLFL